jgi:hypothetical protein
MKTSNKINSFFIVLSHLDELKPGHKMGYFCFFHPIHMPIIEAIIDNNHPIKKGIHSFTSSDSKSEKDSRIKKILLRTGTYQTLLGFCLTMKKQQMAIDKPVKNINIIANLSLKGTVNIMVNATKPIPKEVANANNILIIAL